MSEVKEKLAAFKKRYHLKELSQGIITLLILSISSFFIINWIEFYLWLSPTARMLIFFSYIGFIGFLLYRLVIIPATKLFVESKSISNEYASFLIEKYFPELSDKLTNTIQLSKLSGENQQLLEAAIKKKSLLFNQVNFIEAVDYQIVKKFFVVFGLVISTILLVSFVNPALVKDGAMRLVNYNKEFVKSAPFQFNVLNKSFDVYNGEDFVLKVKLTGDELPEEVFLIDESSNRLRLSSTGDIFEYTFSNLISEKSFILEAAGYRSKSYELDLKNRPELISLNISVIPPLYTNAERQNLTNTGSLLVLEGSEVIWRVSTANTNNVLLLLNNSQIEAERTADFFKMSQMIKEEGKYELRLTNDYDKNKDEISYDIEVIKDKYPEITVEYLFDSINYEFLTITGRISDDYGFTRLRLIEESKRNLDKPIVYSSNSLNPAFVATYYLDSLGFTKGEEAEIYVEVTDNDQINGPKTVKSESYLLRLPTKDEIGKSIEKKAGNVARDLEKASESASSLLQELEELEKRIKTGQEVSWQEEKILEDLIKEKKKINEEIDDLQKAFQQLNKSKNQFEDQSDQIKEKNKKLQELIDQLLDEETLELYEKLKQLLEEESNPNQVQKQLEEIKRNEKHREKELERALELFKRLKLESGLEKSRQRLDSLSKKQEELSQQKIDAEEQDKVYEEFKKFREEMEEIEKLNQNLKRPEPLQDFELEERQIQKELEEIQEGIEQKEKQENTRSEPSETGQQDKQSQEKDRESQIQKQQKGASEKMKSLSQKLSKMQTGMEMEMMQANLDQLRNIADNLVKLSFDQEAIINELRTVNQSDPRFLGLSQQQLKLKDNARVIQDSLLSLAERVVQLSSFVTREVGEINRNIDESLNELRDRNRGKALSSQQFAMTSINNLALLLDDVMQQMQMAMSESMGNSKGQQKQQSQGISELQGMQKQLGEQMNKLQQSGKQGRELSEELARLAAEQEMIRRQMEKMKEAEDGKPGGGLGGDDMEKAIQLMEQNEIDLVNKRLTRQLINRQKQIETRMLEAEKAQREQSQKEEREGEEAKKVARELPPEFEDYIKLKQKEIELLKTVPLDLKPFYKKEVNDYFRRISIDDTP